MLSPTLPLSPVAVTDVPAPDRPPRHRSGVGVVGSLAVVIVAVTLLAATYALAVLDPAGRRLDDAVMAAATDLGAPWRGGVLTLLDVVAVPTVTLAVLGLVALALARGHGRRAAGIVAVVLGSQAVTQVLKAVLPRTGDPEGNSLPSGHVTLVVALGAALVVALPRALRPLAALVAVAAAGLAGVATMVAGWHRPSDLVAAVAVVAAVAGAAGLVAALWPRRPRTA